MADLLRESLLYGFFSGRVGTTTLRRRLARPPGLPATWLDEPAGELEIFPRHLLALCDAVLARELDAVLLESIAETLLASERFRWSGPHPDARVVSEVLALWASPARELPLTVEGVAIIREWVVRRRRPALGPD